MNGINPKAARALVEPVLVISTAHLGEALVMPPDTSFIDTIAVMSGVNGWLIWTGGADEPINVTEKPGEPAAMSVLRDILSLARTLECSYVMFDSDGEKLAPFPTYDW